MRSGYGLRRSDKESTAGNSLHRLTQSVCVRTRPNAYETYVSDIKKCKGALYRSKITDKVPFSFFEGKSGKEAPRRRRV